MEEDAKFAKKADGLLPSIERIRAKVKEQNDEQFLAVICRGEYRPLIPQCRRELLLNEQTTEELPEEKILFRVDV